jgi:hypothetical protein
MEEQAAQRDLSRATKVFESRGLNGQEHLVDGVKRAASTLFWEIDSIPIPPGNTEAGRLVSLAKTALEESVMWATKAVSRSH